MTSLAAPSRRTRPSVSPKWLAVLAIVAVAYIVPPIVGSDYLYRALLIPFLALSLAAVGLNLLTGYAGQVSLGSGAFMAVGAFAAFNLNLRVPSLPFIVNIILAGGIAAAVGFVFGLPSLRLRGFYLAVSTLGAQFFMHWLFHSYGWFENNSPSGVADAPPYSAFGQVIRSSFGIYASTLTLVIVLTFLVARLVHTQTGLNFIAIRDGETAAKVIGVPILRTKLLVFSLSSFIIGISGVLWACGYLHTIEPDGFDLGRSFQILFIIIIGGLASIPGAFLGAAFIVIFPLIMSRVGAAIFPGIDSGVLENAEKIVIGALIIIILILEPDGLNAFLQRGLKWLRRGSPVSESTTGAAPHSIAAQRQMAVRPDATSKKTFGDREV